MDKENSYANINLDRVSRPRPHRIVAVVIVEVVAILLWVILSDTVAFFLVTLFLLAPSVWMGTYGLEEAMDDLIRFFKRLKNLF